MVAETLGFFQHACGPKASRARGDGEDEEESALPRRHHVQRQKSQQIGPAVIDPLAGEAWQSYKRRNHREEQGGEATAAEQRRSDLLHLMELISGSRGRFEPPAAPRHSDA